MQHPSSIQSISPTQKTPGGEGLTSAVAARRLQEHGRNQIRHDERRSPFLLLFEQFKNTFVLLMLGAAVLSFVLQSWRDGVILLLVVLLNAVVGFYQDWKAENILASLRQLVVEKCYVLRGGVKLEIPAEELVPGDLVFLEEGDGVPADIRLTEANGLSANEFILTGESQPREKRHDIELTADLPPEVSGQALAERENCLFMGTTIAKGEGRGIVTATGMNAELGKIAGESFKIDASPTPLQRELNIVGKRISILTLVLAAVMLGGRLLYGEPLDAAVIFAISVAAAMVPEGLPTQISVSLALGVARLAKKKAVVKKLSAVEALGAATVIAADKTGTITKNEMTIIHAWLNGRNFTVAGTGYEPVGEIFDVDGNAMTKENLADEKVFFLNGFLGSTGKVNPPDPHHPHWYPVGDPTEAAFATLLMKGGYDPADIERAYPRLQLFPFDSYRKRMSIVRQHKGKTIAFIKGSIESVLEICPRAISQGQVHPLSQAQKNDLIEAAKVQAAEAHRIIALAYKDLPSREDSPGDSKSPGELREDSPGDSKSPGELTEVENDAVFAGFATMIDPPHEEVHQAVQTAYQAGIRVLMITGDNEITARAVATQIGMTAADGSLPPIINEGQLKGMDDAQLKTMLAQRSVIFSRTSPSDKLRIVSLLQERGDVVAVTGDGVNDTLSLKKSDVGVAMGQRGSRVAQESSSMVLLDDDFSTIVHAIEQGRNIYANLKKITLANLNGNVAELTCILIGFAGAFWGYPLALLPVHILLIDLIGNMLPLLTVTFDPPEGDLMRQPPRKMGEMLNRRSLLWLSGTGILKGLLAFAACALTYEQHVGEAFRHERAVTVTLTALIVLQFVNIFSGRTVKGVFGSYFFSNPYLFLGMGSSLLFIGVISYLPFLNPLLHTAPLDLRDWSSVLGAAAVYLGVEMMIAILEDLGATVAWSGPNVVQVDPAGVQSKPLDPGLCAKIRASILLAAPLLARFGQVTLPPPGGDVIGRRRVDTHFLALEALGATVLVGARGYEIEAKSLVGADIFLDEPSVTGTENALMAAAAAAGTTILRNAASEPHVQDLARLLVAMGADIQGIGSNTYVVRGGTPLHGASYEIGPDHIEIGSFIGLAAVTNGQMTIEGVRGDDLRATLIGFDRLGIRPRLDGDRLIVDRDQERRIRADVGGHVPKLEDGPWPAFPADTMSIAVVAATQCTGMVLIFEKMFESRLYFVDKLIGMGARIVLCDPHRAVIAGPSPLRGGPVESPDIRAGMAMLLAALAAEGQSTIHNIGQIERGYERIDTRLRALGAAIERVDG